MIKVSINSNKIVITGHAGFDDYGKDIVCASVSSIVITSVNLALRINSDSIKYESLKDKLLIEVLSDNDIIKKIIDNMISLLDELCTQYPKNIKIVKEERP